MDYFLNDISDPQYLTERAWYKSSRLLTDLVNIVYKVYKEEKRRIKYTTNVYCPGGCTVSTEIFKEEYRAPGYKSYDILLYVDPTSSERATMGMVLLRKDLNFLEKYLKKLWKFFQ